MYEYNSHYVVNLQQKYLLLDVYEKMLFCITDGYTQTLALILTGKDRIVIEYNNDTGEVWRRILTEDAKAVATQTNR